MIPADDPIPVTRRYHTDAKFRAQIDAERQAHYDSFYTSTSAAIDRANPRAHWEDEA